MSIFDLSQNRTNNIKEELKSLTDAELQLIADDLLKDDSALFQGFIGLRSKKVVYQTAAYQILKEREYIRTHGKKEMKKWD